MQAMPQKPNAPFRIGNGQSLPDEGRSRVGSGNGEKDSRRTALCSPSAAPLVSGVHESANDGRRRRNGNGAICEMRLRPGESRALRTH